MVKDKEDNTNQDFLDKDNTAISPGAALAGMRKIIMVTCHHCGDVFKGTSRAKFCTNKCKQADKYKRSKEK